MSEARPLSPATRTELVTALAYALRFDTQGKPHRQASDLAAQIAAETLATSLEQAGFVVMKRAAASAPSTPKGV